MNTSLDQRLKSLATIGVPEPDTEAVLTRARRRRRRTRTAVVLAGAFAATSLLYAVAAVTEPAERDDIIAGPDQTSVGQPSTTTTSVAPDNDTLGPAAQIVADFIGRLRTGDTAGATALWSGYPTHRPGEPSKTADVEALGASHSWLLDPTTQVYATPTESPSFVVVTAANELPAGGSESVPVAAFVVRIGAVTLIERLPEPAPGATPPGGSPVSGGETVTINAAPVEGGQVAHVDGRLAVSRLAAGRTSIEVQLPTALDDGVIVTVSWSTPEIPAAAAYWFPLSR